MCKMKYAVPDLLAGIKAKYEDDLDKPISMYRLILQSYSGDSQQCILAAEHVLEYDDLCVRLFDLDVSGWEVVNVSDSLNNFISPHKYDIVEHVLVTITLFRKL